MTVCCHVSSATIEEAARWWIASSTKRSTPAVRELRARFGLTPAEVCETLALVGEIRRNSGGRAR